MRIFGGLEIAAIAEWRRGRKKDRAAGRADQDSAYLVPEDHPARPERSMHRPGHDRKGGRFPEKNPSHGWNSALARILFPCSFRVPSVAWIEGPSARP